MLVRLHVFFSRFRIRLTATRCTSPSTSAARRYHQRTLMIWYITSQPATDNSKSNCLYITLQEQYSLLTVLWIVAGPGYGLGNGSRYGLGNGWGNGSMKWLGQWLEERLGEWLGKFWGMVWKWLITCCKMMSSNVTLLHSNNCRVVFYSHEPAICDNLDLHVVIFSQRLYRRLLWKFSQNFLKL